MSRYNLYLFINYYKAGLVLLICLFSMSGLLFKGLEDTPYMSFMKLYALKQLQ